MEYATREQAQNAINTLSNQNLMGRLVYVREVSITHHKQTENTRLTSSQDRETEPRFSAGGARGGFDGARGGRGGFGGGYGGGPMAAGPGRQIYVSNVRMPVTPHAP